MTDINTEEDAYQALRDPFTFIERVWWLTPQKILPDYGEIFYRARRMWDYRPIKLSMFEPFDPEKHITWQQVEVIRAINYAMKWVKPRDISIRSGRGIGKTAISAIIILWFLFAYPMCKIPCTAPTQNQMYDVLWAEIALWLNKMPKVIKDMYEWSKDHIRMKESPENWFARARTATKESPEALSGIHAPFIAQIIDEASAVPDEIFDNAEATLTNPDYVTLMISNPTRMIGRFYDTHNKLKKHYQTMQFSSEESPVVDRAKITKIIEKYGMDSPQYLVEVLGEFPSTDPIDEKGYMPLINFPISVTDDYYFIGDCNMGCDPAGDWGDTTEIVVRDHAKAWNMASELKSNPKSVANLMATVLLTTPCNSKVIDNFWEGANVWVELAHMGIRSSPINVWDTDGVDERFLNIRAELFWKAREWLRMGGEVSKEIAEEMKSIKYKMNMRGKIQIMSKEEMRKIWIASPNKADAFMLTFYAGIKERLQRVQKYDPLFVPSKKRRNGDIYE